MGYTNTLALILLGLWLYSVGVFGLFLTFAKPVRIERPVFVGLMTLLTCAIALVLTINELRLGLRSSSATYVSIALVAILGFPVGRAIDYLLGPSDPRPEETVADLGADLAD